MSVTLSGPRRGIRHAYAAREAEPAIGPPWVWVRDGPRELEVGFGLMSAQQAVVSHREYPAVEPTAPRGWEGLRRLRFSAAILVQGLGTVPRGEGAGVAGLPTSRACHDGDRLARSAPPLLGCNMDNNSPI
jgi:hypothetical protein